MWWWGVKGHFVVHEICVIRRSNDVTFWIVTLFDALSNLQCFLTPRLFTTFSFFRPKRRLRNRSLHQILYKILFTITGCSVGKYQYQANVFIVLVKKWHVFATKFYKATFPLASKILISQTSMICRTLRKGNIIAIMNSGLMQAIWEQSARCLKVYG